MSPTFNCLSNGSVFLLLTEFRVVTFRRFDRCSGKQRIESSKSLPIDVVISVAFGFLVEVLSDISDYLRDSLWSQATLVRCLWHLLSYPQYQLMS